jgi:hypothetical protein
MKILQSTPLLVSGAVIAIAAGFILTNSHIAVEDVLSMGVGIATVVGILGMLVRDTAQSSCA